MGHLIGNIIISEDGKTALAITQVAPKTDLFSIVYQTRIIGEFEVNPEMTVKGTEILCTGRDGIERLLKDDGIETQKEYHLMTRKEILQTYGIKVEPDDFFDSTDSNITDSLN